MEIKNTTVYTKKRIIKYHRHYVLDRLVVWLILIASTAFILSCDILMLLAGGEFFTSLTITILLIDILYPLLSLVILPNIHVKKVKTVGATVEYAFKNDEILMHSKNEHLDETSIIKYTMLLKVIKNKNELYLYISSNQAFILDITGSKPDDVIKIKRLLRKNVKKVIWN